MKFRKTLFLAVLALLLFTVACSKDSGEEKGKEKPTGSEESIANLNTDGEFPIVKEKIELDMFVTRVPGANDWNDILIWNTYEEMTNVKVNWEMVPSDSIDEKRNLKFASNQNLPDVFYASGITPLDILKYGEQGVIVPLNDLIDEYAPNIKKLFEQYPDVEAALTFPDGNIYSLPGFYSPEFLSLIVGNRPWFNEKWLEEFGMEVPETTEEFYEYLKAVKENDPAGTGKSVGFGTSNMDYLVNWVRGAFGLGNTGRNYIDKDPETGQVRFYPVSDEYKEMLKYLHKLYSEGLIEQNIFSIEQGQFLANAAEGNYGSTVFWTPADLFGEAGADFVGGQALEGPKGDKQFNYINYPAYNIGKFVMTSENEHPEATMRWIDYFYSDEGSRLMFMGVEGETYEVTDDGEYVFMDHIRNSKEGLTLDQEVAKYLTWVVGVPGVLKEEYFQGSEKHPTALESAERLKPYLIDEHWPAFLYTHEENRQLSTLENDIHKYVDEMRDLFIAGNESIDDKWEDYVKQIEQMNLEKYLELVNGAYDRFKESQK